MLVYSLLKPTQNRKGIEMALRLRSSTQKKGVTKWGQQGYWNPRRVGRNLMWAVSSSRMLSKVPPRSPTRRRVKRTTQALVMECQRSLLLRLPGLTNPLEIGHHYLKLVNKVSTRSQVFKCHLLNLNWEKVITREQINTDSLLRGVFLWPETTIRLS